MELAEFEIQPSDVPAIDAVVDELANRFATVEDAGFQREAAVAAHELPRTLRHAMRDFKLREPAPGLLLRGLPVDDEAIGPTPSSWADGGASRTAFREEIFLCLCATLLGEPIAWATQQDGRVMHDLVPTAGDEGEQLGSGSSVTLEWHTEEAFHPCRADYVGLLCLRNPDQVATTLADVMDVRVDPEVAEVLRQPLYRIRPDRSHLRAREAPDPELRDLFERCQAWVHAIDENPPALPILFGAPDDPYLRADPHFTEPPPSDAARAAFDRLCSEISRNLTEVALAPGEILFIDNFRAVHGRSPFRARYDGTDRWMKRVNVAMDLRKSREHRRSSASRTIY